MPVLRTLLVLLLLGGGLLGCMRWPEGVPPAPRSLEVEEIEVTAENALRPVPLSRLPLLLDDGALAVDAARAVTTDDGGDGSSGRWDSLRLALERHRGWLKNRPADRRYTFGPKQVSGRRLLDMADRILAWLDDDPTPEALAVRMAYELEAYESIGREPVGTGPRQPGNETPGDGRNMLITGYYVPVIEGSLRKRPGYEVPIYGPPRGLIRADLGEWSDEWKGRRIAGILDGGRFRPFPDRQGIRQGVAALRGREIAWAKDPVDLFFVEVQGSGVLRLPDGSERRIGYASANGRPYRSVGRLLIDEGKVPRERMSMQAIRQYLADHPEELHRVLDHNPSQVFFRLLDGPPVGNLGIPVTAGRSIAVDQKLFPPGGFGFLLTDLPGAAPDGSTVVEGRISRFVLAQDTGGAIRGADRADFFWGGGAEAAERAGVMKQPGRLLFFVPKDP